MSGCIPEFGSLPKLTSQHIVMTAGEITPQRTHIHADIWQHLLTYSTVWSRNSALLKASFSFYPSPKGSLRKFIMRFQPSPPLRVVSVVVAAYSTLGCSCLNYRLFVGSSLVGSNLWKRTCISAMLTISPTCLLFLVYLKLLLLWLINSFSKLSLIKLLLLFSHPLVPWAVPY